MAVPARRRPNSVLLLALGLALSGCSSFEGFRDPDAPLRKALTFHASFDRGTDADFALGDPWLYTAPSIDKAAEARPGLPPADDDFQLETNAGRYGAALHFTRRTDAVVFYRGRDNAPWAPKNWGGTVSFWLRTELADLPTGFCDPIHLTPRTWNDAAFFVEFEKRETGVPFRLGAYADYRVWNPRDLPFDDIPAAGRPLVTVDGPPFNGARWTHVAFTWEGFNTGTPNGTAVLYLDGGHVGTIRGRTQTFTWNTADLRLLLGVGYVGWIDDVAVFNRALSQEEIQRLRRLPQGIRSLLAK